MGACDDPDDEARFRALAGVRQLLEEAKTFGSSPPSREQLAATYRAWRSKMIEKLIERGYPLEQAETKADELMAPIRRNLDL